MSKDKISKTKNVFSYLKLTPLRFVLIVLFIISCVVCLFQIGKNVEAPYPLSISPEGNYSNEYKEYITEGIIVEGKNASVMLDSGFTRCVIMDKNQQVVSIKRSEIFEETMSYYQSACITDNAIYILYVEKYTHTDNVKREILYKVDFNGDFISTIWNQEYDKETQQFRIPRMISLEQDNENRLYGILLSANEDEISIVSFVDGSYTIEKSFKINFGRETIIDVSYNVVTDTISIVTDTDSLYINNGDSYTEYNLIRNENDVNKYLVSNDNNSISPINEDIKYVFAPEVLYFAPILIFKTIIFWLCLAYIIIFILFLIIRMFVNIIINKNADLLIRIAIVSAAIIGMLGISIYYSYQIFNADIKTKIDLMQYSSLNLSSTPNDYAKNIIKKINDASDLKKDEYFDFKDYLETLRNNAIESQFSLDYTIYKINRTDIFHSKNVCSTELKVQYGLDDGFVQYEKIKGDLENDGSAIYLYRNMLGTYMCAYSIIYDDSESIGIAEVSCNYWLYISSLIRNTLTIFLTLSVIIIVLVTFFIEIGAAIRAKKLKQKYLKLKIKHPEIAYNRLFAFLCNFLSTFNSVLLVLIAKDIISASNLENEAVLIALPTFFLSFGIFWGQPLFHFLSKRFNIKTIIVTCCVLMFVTYIMCFQAVAMSNFWYFNVVTLVSSLGTGLITSIRAYMPVLAPDEKIRYELNSGSTKTWISAGIVSIAVAGFVSDMFGSASIYILALVPVLLILFMSIFLMPNNVRYYLEKNEKKRSHMFSRTLQFFFQPAFLIYALGLIAACVLCHGYRNFMFPLFTDDAGISNSMISNIVVIANFIAFALNSQLNRMVKRMDFWELGIVATIIAGILYVSFAINSGVTWACIVIILVTMLIRFMSTVNGMLWPRLCKQCDYPMSTANTVILCYTNIISAIQGFVLSALLLLGMINACICIGVFMLIVGVLFAIITYNTALRKNKIN